MTDAEILSALKKIHEIQIEIRDLAKQRQLEESQLCEEYRVNECNSRRNELVVRYQGLMNAKISQINDLENQLGEKTH